MTGVAYRSGLSLALAAERVKLFTWPNGRRTLWITLIDAAGTAFFLLTVHLTTGSALADLTDRQRLRSFSWGSMWPT